jgi:hypothetical protein
MVFLFAIGRDSLFNYSGYCWKEQKKFTDEELIQIALRDRFFSGVVEADGGDESFRDFHKKHPACCRVDRNPSSRGIFDRLFGFYISEVEINSTVPPERVREIGPYYEAHISIRPCGEVVGVYGTGNQSPKEVVKN